MANIAGFAIGTALGSDLGDAERMRMGLIGALMPSPLVGALIVEALVESEQGDGGKVDEPGAVGKATEAPAITPETYREERMQHLRREENAVNTQEQQIIDSVARTQRRGGFTPQAYEDLASEIEELNRRREKVADDREQLLQAVVRHAKPPEENAESGNDEERTQAS